jgi:[ribosomal protein S5]-alanine N-acetyltransferase
VIAMMAPYIESERLYYEPLSLKHLSQDYVDWLNDPEVYKYLETGGDYTIEMLLSYLKDVEKKDIYFWAIHLKETHVHIGNIKIDPINKRHGTAEYGIMMGKRSEWAKGYAREASERIIRFCFQNIKIRKITLGVVANNIAAVNLYQRLNFETEGVYKNHGIYLGKYCDIYRMALFNPEFVSNNE